jgi:hypothetical protein
MDEKEKVTQRTKPNKVTYREKELSHDSDQTKGFD